MIAKVAVSAAPFYIDKPYDYLVPTELESGMCEGIRVIVPFARGNRLCEGVVLALEESSDYRSLKNITRILDDTPVLTQKDIKLAHFMREHFFCSFYDAVRAMLPPGLWFSGAGTRTNDKFVPYARLTVPPEDAAAFADEVRKKSPKQAEIVDLLCSFEVLPVKEVLLHCGTTKTTLNSLVKKGMAELFEREVYRTPHISDVKSSELPLLSAQQQEVFSQLNEIACTYTPCAALLQGVTGSGKTAVYLHLISQQLARGRSAILLVPEIALTPQTIATIASHFGKDVAVMHSNLSSGERYDEWKRIRRGEVKMVVGTRSAIFAPLSNIGIIIIDEEHDSSYISESSPRYNTIDVAKYLCSTEKCMLLLGSATPDIVTRYNAEIGKYRYFRLTERYNRKPLPEYLISDMRGELRNGNSEVLGSLLRGEIAKNVENGEQSLLFVNRRGSNKLVCCGECGYTFNCPRCSASLTYHGNNRRLICHYCGYSRQLPDKCPDCGGKLAFIGAGTQQIEEEIRQAFPGVEILRADADSVIQAGSHEALFSRFREEKIPILVGTQMIVKGHNFGEVTLVGVISADQGLYSDDYLAAEKVFSCITQVVGRSGRGEKSGRAVIQTFTPENPTLKLAAMQDYDAFYETEIESRKLIGAPPFNDYISVNATDFDIGSVQRCLNNVADYLKTYADSGNISEILGPVPMMVERVNNRFRYRLNIVCKADRKTRVLIASAVRDAIRRSSSKSIVLYADANSSD